MSITGRFVETAQALPDKVAIFDITGSHTYGTLLGAAQAIAARVRATSEREHVAVLAPTCAAFPIAYFGALLADKVPVPLNFLLDANTLGFVARDAGFDTVVGSKFFGNLVEALGSKAIFVEDSLAPLSEAPEPTRGDDDAAALLYTSGTTGVPKGVVLTHRNLLANMEGCLEHAGMTENEVFLGVLPLFHSFGLTASMLIPLLLGCQAAYVAKFSPQRVFEAIARHRVTIVFAVASMYRVLLRAGRPPGLDLSSLRLVIAGGEALGAPLAQRFEEVLGLPLLEGYGLTETSPVVAFNLPDRRRLGSVGPMLRWVEAQVADDQDQRLPSAQEGELWLRGDCVTPGYHNRPEETAAAFTPSGWFRTGDLARIDPDGYLWITGRKKDLIISGGENVSPNEIEAVLHQHPAVFEAAVIGVPDESRGEVPKAFVTLRQGEGAEAADLAAFCRERLPRYKVPAAFELRAELPHTPAGKVHKLTLRKAEGLA